MEVRSNSAQSPLPARWAATDCSRLLGGGAGIEENDDRWAGAAEGCAEDAWFPGQFLQTRQQGAERGAVRLMDAVFERGGEQVVTPLGEGGEQEHGVLDVGDGIGARILRGEHAAGFFGGQGLIGDGKKQRPLPFRADADHLGFGVCRTCGRR